MLIPACRVKTHQYTLESGRFQYLCENNSLKRAVPRYTVDFCPMLPFCFDKNISRRILWRLTLESSEGDFRARRVSLNMRKHMGKGEI